MKLNLLSFTDYQLKINLYYKKDMDFFSFLLLKIITKEEKENRSLKDILKDFDITEPIMYLVSSSFYELIDNNLIEVNEEDLEKIKHKDIIVNELAYQCLENNYILIYEKEVKKNVCINPIEGQIVSASSDYVDDYLVVPQALSKEKINEIINENSHKLFNDSGDYIYEVEILEANPLVSSYDVKNLEFNDKVKEIVLNNLQYYPKEGKKDYQKDLVILTKEYKLEESKEYDFIAILDKQRYGCEYYQIDSNVGIIPMIKRIKIK